MLAKRIIPCLDIMDGRVVKGIRFLGLRDAGDPVEQAAAYDAARADELVFLDITASHERRGIVRDVVRGVADAVSIPFTVGGGLRTLDDIHEVLLAGADKVSLNSAAVRNPDLVTQAAHRFGCQCIVVAIDARRRSRDGADTAQGGARACCRGVAFGEEAPSPGRVLSPNALPLRAVDGTSTWEVTINGGRTPMGLEAVAWAREAEARGAGEILLTSMDRDGTRDGYDLELTRAVAEAVSIPVIASGGAGSLEHLAQVLTVGGADAALVASLFHYGELTVPEAKAYLAACGIPVRI